jgi:predicted transcriptional regulator
MSTDQDILKQQALASAILPQLWQFNPIGTKILAVVSLAGDKSFLAQEIQTAASCSRSTALKYADSLVDMGLLEKQILKGTEHKSKPTHIYQLDKKWNFERINDLIKDCTLPGLRDQWKKNFISIPIPNIDGDNNDYDKNETSIEENNDNSEQLESTISPESDVVENIELLLDKNPKILKNQGNARLENKTNDSRYFDVDEPTSREDSLLITNKLNEVFLNEIIDEIIELKKGMEKLKKEDHSVQQEIIKEIKQEIIKEIKQEIIKEMTTVKIRLEQLEAETNKEKARIAGKLDQLLELKKMQSGQLSD